MVPSLQLLPGPHDPSLEWLSLLLWVEMAPLLTSFLPSLGQPDHFLNRDTRDSQAGATCLAPEQPRPASGAIRTPGHPGQARWTARWMAGMVCMTLQNGQVQVPRGPRCGADSKGCHPVDDGGCKVGGEDPLQCGPGWAGVGVAWGSLFLSNRAWFFSMTVLPSPEVLIPQSARRSSTRTLAATPWWSWRTRTRNVQSARGSCEELAGPGPPAGPDSPMYSPAYQ